MRTAAMAMLAFVTLVPTDAALAGQVVVDDLSQHLKITWELTRNFPDPPLLCPEADGGNCFAATVRLDYGGPTMQGDRLWQMYFSSVRRVLRSESPNFQVDHVTGTPWHLNSPRELTYKHARVCASVRSIYLR